MGLGMGQAGRRGEVETGGGESESGGHFNACVYVGCRLCWRTWRSVVVAAGVATGRGHHRPAPPREDEPDHEPSIVRTYRTVRLPSCTPCTTLLRLVPEPSP